MKHRHCVAVTLLCLLRIFMGQTVRSEGATKTKASDSYRCTFSLKIEEIVRSSHIRKPALD